MSVKQEPRSLKKPLETRFPLIVCLDPNWNWERALARRRWSFDERNIAAPTQKWSASRQRRHAPVFCYQRGGPCQFSMNLRIGKISRNASTTIWVPSVELLSTTSTSNSAKIDIDLRSQLNVRRRLWLRL
jgi:hypothetical protein